MEKMMMMFTTSFLLFAATHAFTHTHKHTYSSIQHYAVPSSRSTRSAEDAAYIARVLKEDDEEFERKWREKQLEKLHEENLKKQANSEADATAEKLLSKFPSIIKGDVNGSSDGEENESSQERVVQAALGAGVDFRMLALPELTGTSTGTDGSEGNKIIPVVDGEIANSKQGTYVGSAGGWSLEVFPGDFVVHRKYGIGRFERVVLKNKKLNKEARSTENQIRQQILDKAREEGKTDAEIKKLAATFQTKQFVEREQVTVLEIQYADAILHVPVDKAYRLSRYRGGEAVVKPKLSKMKGDTWKKQTAKIMESTKALAEDVLALYATRETLTRQPFDPKYEAIVTAFGETFTYKPTPDQISCFEDIGNDMVWRRRPMDRLVCGDVGFGKTEVALRAIYRCVANKRQVAFLAPTGVLAAQHMKNVIARMGEGTEFETDCCLLRGGLGRTKAGKEIRDRIKSGEIKVIVGTHALLSKNVEFNNLGLLVIDEEQRFGVKQKERLKMISSGVDVLTMSATPIPRTLQMSMSGIRDTSTIRTPPPMRKATKTIVEPFKLSTVRKAVHLELERGGQCYYVVPRVAMIERVEQMFHEEFPGIKVLVAHGQMGKGMCEAAVEDFAMGNADVLIATTVIENGVDIPNSNTIIIQQAQAFGMSTLYQLRGRVGRSNMQAYAYLLHGDEQTITPEAQGRLKAMAELHELGSGFDIATRDLEIRGAGSLLGTEQSGMAGKIGFDLYMRMLKKAILKMKGLGLPSVLRTNARLPDMEGSIEDEYAFTIPKTYIKDHIERQREENSARLAESSAVLVQLTNEWKDKYGSLPDSLKQNLKALHLHASTRILGIDYIGVDETNNVGVLRAPGLRPRMWAQLCQRLSGGNPPPGVTAVFPPRFAAARNNVNGEQQGSDFEINLESLGPSFSESDEDTDWDEYDDEEVESMKDITSAAAATSLEEANATDYPRLIISGLGNVESGAKVDVLLKSLLPLVKVASALEEEDKQRAKVAVELREKRQIMKKAKQGTTNKKGYYY